MSYVLLCTEDDGAPSVMGAGADDCPTGEPFVRWEWTGNSFVAEGDDVGTNVTATAFKATNEPIEAAWSSTEFNVTGIVVGAGGESCLDDGGSGLLPHTGFVETCPGSAGASGMTSIPYAPTWVTLWITLGVFAAVTSIPAVRSRGWIA